MEPVGAVGHGHRRRANAHAHAGHQRAALPSVAVAAVPAATGARRHPATGRDGGGTLLSSNVDCRFANWGRL